MKLGKKRTLAIIVALVMIVPGLSAASSPFVDVTPGRFFEAPINWAFANHITTGRDASHFVPNASVTRGESVTFLKRYDDNIVQPSVAGLGSRIDGLGQTLGGLTCSTSEVAYHDGATWRCGSPRLVYAVGGPTSAPAYLDTTIGSAWSISVAVTPDGLPVVSYLNNLSNDLMVAKCTNPSCTTAPVVTSVLTLGAVGLDSSLAVGSDGFPIISSRDATAGSLVVVHCADMSCTTSSSAVVDDGGSHAVGQYTAISIGSDGLAVISYRDSTSKDLKVAHCNDVACSTATKFVVDTATDTGLFTSLAIGSDGLPVISYYDSTSRALKVAHCTDRSCSASAITTVDGGSPLTTDVGVDSSVAVGADGLPVISYHDSRNGALKVAHCTNVTCSTSTITTIDAVGDVGWATSLSMGIDSLPVIAYADATNRDLKIAHCLDRSCHTADTLALDTVGDVGRVTSIAIGVDGLPIIGYNALTVPGLKIVQARMTPIGLTHS